MARSKEYLRKLRQKYHLGEYKRPRGTKARSSTRSAPKKRKKPAGPGLPPYRAGYLGYPGYSEKENILRYYGVPEFGYTGPMPGKAPK